jgi:hypothetical protein
MSDPQRLCQCSGLECATSRHELIHAPAKQLQAVNEILALLWRSLTVGCLGQSREPAADFARQRSHLKKVQPVLQGPEQPPAGRSPGHGEPVAAAQEAPELLEDHTLG